VNVTDCEVLSSKCSEIFIDCERLDAVRIVGGQLRRRAKMTRSVGIGCQD
jgi:hypothetical protein